MKKNLAILGMAMAMCLPVYAEEQFTNDSRTAADYPVFGEESQTRANLGLNANQTISQSGSIRKNALKPEITDPEDPDYVPPVASKASKKRKKHAHGEEKQAPIPVYLSGDHVEFENESGDFLAVGEVKVSQGDETLLTSHAFGNVKTGDVYLLQGGTLLEPGNRLEGKWAHYNFNSKTGEMKEIRGRGTKDFYKAAHVLVLPDKVVADQGGEVTRCFAKEHVPCVAVKAKSIEFYPQEKIVAHDVKVYIKGKHVYSRKLWVNEFGDENKSMIKPSVGWNGKDNGWYAKLELAQPLTEKTTAKITLMQYSRAGFKPMYSVSHDERNFRVKYSTGWEEDDDYWYLKQNNWEFKYRPRHFVKGLPLTYSMQFERGLWRRWDSDNQRSSPSSWHTEFKYYINHDPIKLFGPDTTLHLTYGRKWVHESNNGSGVSEKRTTNMYYATLRQKVTKNWDMWAGYLHEKKTSNIFDLGQSDMDREFRLGMQIRPTERDVLSVVNRYDISTHSQYKTTYNWYHRFCCWALQLSYEKNWYKDDNKLMLHYYLYNW